MIAEHKNDQKVETMNPVRQMQQKITLNDEIISSLKESFGTSLSDFLKVYRDFQPRQTFFESKDVEMENI